MELKGHKEKDKVQMSKYNVRTSGCSLFLYNMFNFYKCDACGILKLGRIELLRDILNCFKLVRKINKLDILQH